MAMQWVAYFWISIIYNPGFLLTFWAEVEGDYQTARDVFRQTICP